MSITVKYKTARYNIFNKVILTKGRKALAILSIRIKEQYETEKSCHRHYYQLNH